VKDYEAGEGFIDDNENYRDDIAVIQNTSDRQLLKKNKML